MLRPDNRRSLVDSLRPEPGWRLDLAVGTTYGLNLTALLVVPAAYALFDRNAVAQDDQALDGGEPATPLGLLNAVHRTAGRIIIFCDAAQIAPPLHRRRRLLGLIEQVVVPAAAPGGGAFHPKVWMLRFVAGGETRYRLLIASRNLTLDRCWDTMTVLESDPAGITVPGLGAFLRALPDTAATPIPAEGRKRVTALADEMESIRFAAPEGFTSLRLHAFGLGKAAWPFPKRCDRLLVVSPFLSTETLFRLPEATGTRALVSRAEALSAAALATVAYQCFTLNSTVTDPAPDDSPATRDDPGRIHGGLHAKLYVADQADGTTWWCGSANATTAALTHNVEVLLEMRTGLGRLSAREMLRQRADEDPAARRFRDLLVPWEPEETPVCTDDTRDELDELRRRLAVIGFSATVIETATDSYRVTYRSDGSLDLPPAVELRCWPASVVRDDVPLALANDGMLEYVATATITTLTAFLVLELTRDRERTAFVVRCELIDPPLNRHQRLIAELIGDASRLLRYLLALLADDEMDLAQEDAVRPGDRRWSASDLESIPLQEVMVKTLARDPARLRDVAELLDTLRDSGTPLPEGLDQLWQAVWQIAQEDT